MSDASCMRLCEQYGFPCYDFQYSDFHPVIPICLFMNVWSSPAIWFPFSEGQGVAVCTRTDRGIEVAASSESVRGWGERERDSTTMCVQYCIDRCFH